MFSKLSFRAKSYIWAFFSFIFSVLSLAVVVMIFPLFPPDQVESILIYCFFLIHFFSFRFYTLFYYKHFILPRLSGDGHA